MFELQNTFRASPRIILVASLLAWLIANKMIYFRFAAYLVITHYIAVFIKKLNATFLAPIHPTVAYRPPGAGNCTGCGQFANHSSACIDASEQIGMASGHSMTAMMAATFWICRIYIFGKNSIFSKTLRAALLLFLALVVMYTRSSCVENCHTWSQIFVGGAIGVFLGVGFFFMDSKCLSKITLCDFTR